VVRSSVANRVSAIAALFLLIMLPSPPSFAQISQQTMQQCSALLNSVRRVTCYDLLTQLRVTEPAETTGQGEGVMMRLHPRADLETRRLDRSSTRTKAEQA
jgi:hypothetical protein